MDQYIFFTINEEPVIKGDKVCLQNTLNDSIEMVKLDKEIFELVKATFPGYNLRLDLNENKIHLDNYEKGLMKNNGGKWRHKDILRLINLRKEKSAMFNSTILRNEEVWEKIAAEMPCFNKSQVKDKWQYLRKKYIKKKITCPLKPVGLNCLNSNISQKWTIYWEKKPNIVPKHVASSMKGACVDSVNHDNDALEDSEQPAKKKKQNSHDNSLLKYLKEEATKREEARKKRHEEIMDVRNRSIEVFSEKMDKLIEKF